MRGHAITKLKDRTRAFQEHRQEIQGRLPKGPFEFSADLDFTDLTPKEGDPPVVRRLKAPISSAAPSPTIAAANSPARSPPPANEVERTIAGVVQWCQRGTVFHWV